MQIDPQAFTIELGLRLQKLRQDKGLTLDQVVADADLSVSRSSLSAIENGRQDISARDLYATSVVLGFNAGKLIDEVINAVLGQKYSSLNLNR